ncbi:MAG: VWA domain-containing protein [Betaproteobacteria bacterium]
MTFLWPAMLWLLLAVPALVALYVWLQRRKRKGAVRYASLDLVHAAIGPGQRLRRHLPPALFLLALITIIVAIARPTAVITLPTEQRTIVMAMDVSLSMRAADVERTRLAAAQAAAKAFVNELPSDVRIGIVTFAGTATVVQPPTRSRDELVAAIDRFQLQLHTAIGSGLIVALSTLFPDEDISIEQVLFGSAAGRERRPLPSGRIGRDDAKDGKDKPKKAFTPVAAGSYPSGAIILLTDGRRTTGPDPLDAAKMVAGHGVRVYTVGFGTPNGAMVGIEGMSIYMRFDEAALKSIAEITQGEYFYAGTAEDLKKIYQDLNARLVLEKKGTEITMLFTALAALLALAAAGLSLLWFPRFA